MSQYNSVGLDYSTSVDQILSRLTHVRPSARAGEWTACCPAHDDRRPSLSIRQATDGTILLHCHAGCTAEEIVAALGLELRDLFPRGPERRNNQPHRHRETASQQQVYPTATGVISALERSHGQHTAAWSYHDASGELAGVVLRWDKRDREGKPYKLILPVARVEGGWANRAMAEPRPLYRLPQLLQAAGSEPVFVVEGEKACDAAVECGLIATTSAGGANAAAKTDWSPLQGRRVIILPDNDDAGKRYAADVMRLCQAAGAAEVRILDLAPHAPKLPAGGDIADILASPNWCGLPLGDEAKPSDLGELLLRLAEQTPAAAPVAVFESSEHAVWTDDWPQPLAAEAFHGLAGEFVRTVEPSTEADPAALLVQFLVGAGALLGRKPHTIVEADRHSVNEFAVLVGPTAKGRKGTSWGMIRSVLAAADPEFTNSHITSGLSSGEGVIWTVRDAIERPERVGGARGEPPRYEPVQVDPGVTDKRLLIIEPEFASVLRCCERQANTLSAVVRQAWDTGTIRTLTKNSPARTTDAHIAILGHITQEELVRTLSSTEAANGFGNRFLWVCVRRSKLLPDGAIVDPSLIAEFGRRLAEVAAFAASLEAPIRRDAKASALWREIYPLLTADRPGLWGAITARAEAHVLRLSVLYAILDCSPEVRVEHLAAAAAVWQYCENSARCIWGCATGDPLADELLRLMETAPEGLTRTELHQLTGRHVPADRLAVALGVLLRYGLAARERCDTGGRPSERWKALRPAHAKKAK